jgi:adenylate cyclase
MPMPRLVASNIEQRDVVYRQWMLEEGVVLPLGRAVAKDHVLIEWDEQVAPRHAVLTWDKGRLQVDRCSGLPAEQPIFYAGRECESFGILPGEGFVVGKTVFRLDPAVTVGQTSTKMKLTHFYAAGDIHTMNVNPTEEQLTAVRELLFAIESKQQDLRQFAQLVVATVRRVLRTASYVAVLKVMAAKQQLSAVAESDASPGLCPKLVYDGCRRQEMVEYCWDRLQPQPSYEPVAGVAWACCAPIVGRQEGQGDLAIYLCGPSPAAQRDNQPRALTDDQTVFIGIVAWILRSARTIDDLQRSQAWTQTFLPKPIRNLLSQRGPDESFRTEMTQAAVLFCDLRGSCRIAERGAAELMQSWNRLQAALSVMTEAITNQYGTIGDFVGDAAMGFWGWPKVGSASRDLSEAVKAACKAADILRERLRQKARGSGPLAGFACGMGIAAGEVVAGVLGTQDQQKIGVFGPIVNLAARLESMTKQLGVSILIDHTTAKLLFQAETSLVQQVRYLGNVLPVGMDQPVKVFELMPPEADAERLSRSQLQLFEQGQQAFEHGNWQDARRFLERLLDVKDGPSRFLLEYMNSADVPPASFDGVIALARK